MKQHLRIAVSPGNYHAQLAYRWMFGGEGSLPKGVRLVLETKDGNQEKRKQRPHRKHSKSGKQD